MYIASHEDDALDLPFQIGVKAKKQGHVGHRTEGEDGDSTGVLLDGGGQGG